MIGGSSSSSHSITIINLVGMESRGEDFFEDDVMRLYTSDWERRLNSEKVESVTVQLASQM